MAPVEICNVHCFCYCPFNAVQRGRERAIKLTKTLENVLGRLIALKMGYKYNVPLLTHHYYGHHYYGHLLVLVTALELHLCIGVQFQVPNLRGTDRISDHGSPSPISSPSQIHFVCSSDKNGAKTANSTCADRA